LRLWATAAAVAVALVAAVVLALAFTASPASAYGTWAHDGAPGCSCHVQGTPTSATCAAVGCHAGYEPYPDQECWSCHEPGKSTSSLSTPSSACYQECHTWNAIQKQYIDPFEHAEDPHLGSTPECLDCHATSPALDDPGASPHHSGEATGFSQCGACHSSPQKHAGKVACASCHTTAQEFHLYQASSPGYKKCGACHTMKHARKKVAQSKCAQCHKGSSGRTAQHSSKVTKKSVCSGCHRKALHASRVSKAVKSCRTCHKSKFHAAQRTPPKSVCTRCHTVAKRHDNGFQCTLCHRRAVHNSRPSSVNL